MSYPLPLCPPACPPGPPNPPKPDLWTAFVVAKNDYLRGEIGHDELRAALHDWEVVQ